MVPFSYVRAKTIKDAVAERAGEPGSAYLAGGTNLIDDIKLGVESPPRLIDVRGIGTDRIENLPKGGLRIGAGVTNTALAYDGRIQRQFTALSEAILSGASPQLRNVATTGGNLLQRTRCYYFRDTASPCNKREPGSGCSAIGGVNRIHAILGTSEKCIATHPSDMDVAMMAFEAVIHTTGPGGDRAIPIGEFYVPYGEDPAKENVLSPGELIVAVEIEGKPWFARSHYLKARDRSSYEFSLSSAAVALDIHSGVIRDCRVALGGVATKPWRAHAVEDVLRGQRPSDQLFRAAAEREMSQALPQKDNGFKVELCQRVIVKALRTVAGRV